MFLRNLFLRTFRVFHYINFRKRRSNVPLLPAVKAKGRKNFRLVTMLLFYILELEQSEVKDSGFTQLY
jgi:hypothetical protein